MKRTTKGSAVFAASLIAAGILSSGVAMADQRQVIALQLDPICTDRASGQAMFALQNKNNFDLPVSWTNLDTGATGSFVVPANSFNGNDTKVGFATTYNPSLPNNTTSFTAEGWTSPATTNAPEGTACDPSQLPVVVSDPGTGGNGGSTAPTTGGQGAGQVLGDSTAATTTAAAPVAATKQATLAYTGASQILPYSLAALIAVAVIGTTVAVRKNVL